MSEKMMPKPEDIMSLNEKHASKNREEMVEYIGGGDINVLKEIYENLDKLSFEHKEVASSPQTYYSDAQISGIINGHKIIVHKGEMMPEDTNIYSGSFDGTPISEDEAKDIFTKYEYMSIAKKSEKQLVDKAKDDLRKYPVIDTEPDQKEQEKDSRWDKIQGLFVKEETRQGHKLSDFEKLELIRSHEDRDWNTLEDIRKIGASGYFAAPASNIEKHVVGEIKNGEIFNPAENNLNAYGADSSGSLFETWDEAKSWADKQE